MKDFKVYLRNEKNNVSEHFSISATAANSLRIARLLIDANLLTEDSTDVDIMDKGFSSRRHEMFHIDEVETFEA